MSGWDKKCAISCTLSVLDKFFWGQNSENQEALYKSWFQRKLPKTKMTPFLLKKVFWGWAKRCFFTNCVFEKLCSLENTISYSQQNTAVAVKNMHVEKKQKFMKNCGLFLNMAKRCFCLLDLRFNGFVFFVCLVKLQKC